MKHKDKDDKKQQRAEQEYSETEIVQEEDKTPPSDSSSKGLGRSTCAREGIPVDKAPPSKGSGEPIPMDKTVVIAKEEFQKLQQAASEKDKYWDRLLRQQAEFDNFRKRLEKERGEFVKYANEEIILELLIVLDDLERLIFLAEKHKQDFKSFLKGVEMILSHLYELLKKRGIKAIQTKDKKFDPMYHEALMRTESDTCENNKIIEEFQKGYLLENRVIRTAKVKVAIARHTKEGQKSQNEVSKIEKDKSSKVDEDN